MTTNSTLARRSQTDRQNRLIFFGAIGLAILAAILAFAALSNFGGGGDSDGAEGFGAVTEVVVASRDLPAGTRITGDMLELASLPEGAIIDGAFLDTEGLSGLTLRSPLARGEQLSAVKVGQDDDNADSLTYVVPPGKRALAIEIQENTGVGGLVVAGDRVDLIVVIQDANEDGVDLPNRGEVLLQDIEVLAVAQDTLRPTTTLDQEGNPIDTDSAAGSIAERRDDADSQPDAQTVTLAVDPLDAPLVALAQLEGTIFLALRPFGDDEQPDLRPRFIGD